MGFNSGFKGLSNILHENDVPDLQTFPVFSLSFHLSLSQLLSIVMCLFTLQYRRAVSIIGAAASTHRMWVAAVYYNTLQSLTIVGAKGCCGPLTLIC